MFPRERVREMAEASGFDLVGVAPAVSARHGAAFREWLAAGYHADMAWLERNPETRMSPQRWMPEARSMVVVGLSYFTAVPPPELWNDPMRGRIARYAWGRDYHKVFATRLKRLAECLRRECPDMRCLPFSDSRPVMEHDAALAAGLGFIGRNTLLIHPAFGSMLLLGGLLVSAELEPDEPSPGSGAAWHGGEKVADCGTCRRCLQHCPTHAFPAEYILNSSRCISYQTIENRGSIPPDLRPKMGNWIFGCDACQEVCPWVKRVRPRSHSPWLEPIPDRMAPRLAELVSLDEAGFLARFAGTPLMRAKRRGMLRNVAVALGNSESPEAIPLLDTLLREPDAVVREHAQWALGRLRGETTSGGLRP